MIGRYNKNTKLDFGMYKGYELGVVYIFDPSYIDWCINNLNNFYITDLIELKEYNVLNIELNWEYRTVGIPNLFINIDVFETFEEFIANVQFEENKYDFSPETLQKNASKSNIGFSKNKETDYCSDIDDLDDIDNWDDFIEDGEDEEYEDEDEEYFDEEFDQRTWGQKNGYCDNYDSCYSCPYADKCF